MVVVLSEKGVPAFGALKCKVMVLVQNTAETKKEMLGMIECFLFVVYILRESQLVCALFGKFCRVKNKL